MELKAGGMTETEHQRREQLENFRAAIIAAAELDADLASGDADIKLGIPKEAQIHLAFNGTGAWVDAKIWVNATQVGFPWADEVANPPSAEDLAAALRVLLKKVPNSVPRTILQKPMGILARHQGKRSWMDVKL